MNTKKMAILFLKSGVRILADRSALAELSSQLKALSESPVGEYHEANLLLDSLANDQRTMLLFDAEMANALQHARSEKILDIQIMAIEERDFGMYEKLAESNLPVPDEWFGEQEAD